MHLSDECTKSVMPGEDGEVLPRAVKERLRLSQFQEGEDDCDRLILYFRKGTAGSMNWRKLPRKLRASISKGKAYSYC